MIRAFIQARMSSRRFPGKMLAPLAGQPVLAHVIDRVSEAVEKDRIVVLTSEEPSDDPLAAYATSLGVAVFRGTLNDVVGRFQRCLQAHPCQWFFRVCGDSPLLDASLLEHAVKLLEVGPTDLVSNVFPRSYPRGQSVELVRAKPFACLDPTAMTAEEREHVTRFYYTHAERFTIRNFEISDLGRAQQSLCVDETADLARLEALLVERKAIPSADSGP